MRYARLGNVPAKRHVQVRAGAPLLVEEVMGYEGFSATSRSCCTSSRPAGWTTSATPCDRARGWVPDAHVHRLADVNGVEEAAIRSPAAASSCGTTTSRCRSASRPSRSTASTATARATRSSTCTRERGAAHRLRARAVPRARLRRHTARHDAHVRAARGRGAVLGLLPHPGEIETPNRYRNRYGQLLEHSPFSQRDFHRRRSSRRTTRRRVPGHRARARRLPGLRARPAPVRRGRLGRLRLAVHLQRRRLRAARRPLPPAAARAPDLPGPELRDLQRSRRGCSTGTPRP